MAYNKLKELMRCGEIRKSTRSGKKIMKKVCAEGKEKIVHAGAVGYSSNYSDKARKAFKSRHSCSDKKDAFSAQKLACEELWSKSSPVIRKK